MEQERREAKSSTSALPGQRRLRRRVQGEDYPPKEDDFAMTSSLPRGPKKPFRPIKPRGYRAGDRLTAHQGPMSPYNIMYPCKCPFRKGDSVPRYLSQPISFGPEHAEGVLFLHQDPLVVSAEIAGFEVRRILIDGGSSADVMFAGTYAKMGLPTLALSQAPTSLSGFSGEAVQVLGQALIKVAFGSQENRREEEIL
uniref:Uncharacterized protein n=2 Tax=Oryza sativa subsp. japonica TaxID=39947 RepID=Q10IU6_ORYSJ|nr:hypothetical protein [Oryza sativa Japonica Group]ABF96893.1 hypothetical protein LOC_Os03g33040 [Oryza sativa Japonica Group]